MKSSPLTTSPLLCSLIGVSHVTFEDTLEGQSDYPFSGLPLPWSDPPSLTSDHDELDELPPWEHKRRRIVGAFRQIAELVAAIICAYRLLLSPWTAHSSQPNTQGRSLTISQKTRLETVVKYFRESCGLDDLTISLGEANPAESLEYVHRTNLADIYKITLPDGTQVAVKCVARLPHEPDKRLKRSTRELEAWRHLDHENVLQLRGFAVFMGKLAMVSPWMSNGNVIEFLSANQDINRYELCTQLSVAVRYIHDQGVVHGDLKGANILISDDGRIRLTDFGCSVFHDSVLEFSGTDETIGTLRWQAPELIASTGSRSKEADVYSLGMTMLEIITGKRPFHNHENSRLLGSHIAEHGLRPDRPAELDEESTIGGNLWPMLQACWAHPPCQRPTAHDVYCETSLIFGSVPGSLCSQ